MPASYSTPAATPRRRRRRRSHSSFAGRLVRGLLFSIAVTLGCVLLFALLMQWLKPADRTIRIVNQLITLGSIFAGTWFMLSKNSENGLLSGAALGLCYMALGVGLYALLSGQQVPWSAYLSDVAMGIAGGGIAGALIARKN